MAEGNGVPAPAPAAPAKKARIPWIYLIVGGALVALFFASREEQQKRAEPRAIGPVTFDLLDGRKLSLSELRGRVVLVNFWATWCPPCVAELPALQRAHRELSDRFAVIGVSVDDLPPEAITAFAKKHGVSYPIARATQGMKAFGYFSTLPTSFVVGCDGKVRAKISGGMTHRAVVAEVERTRTESSEFCKTPAPAPAPSQGT